MEAPHGAGYRTANTYLATLANLAVFGHLNIYVWSQIFDACKRSFDVTRRHCSQDRPTFTSYYEEKTVERLRRYADQAPHTIDAGLHFNGVAIPSMLEMARISADIIAASPDPEASLIHGDFCFSNIFYDFRSHSVRVIDPRGLSPMGEVSLYGDPRYDVAKLAHSVISGYDMIIAGRVAGSYADGNLSIDLSELSMPRWAIIIEAFERSGIMDAYSRRTIQAMLVQLFLSMLPLHADNPSRQTTFLANAARLFTGLEV
jgi:hypothetical protein